MRFAELTCRKLNSCLPLNNNNNDNNNNNNPILTASVKNITNKMQI